ncbi:hypothetical protein [Saccharothrix syringae]|uniref:SRPBCC family protein n=1 Tax=Saccharothrix syringae TaxID=103733 RepID=A0A5Q0GZJ2_SACSY|nr:hypothetical protein [Saccharothrix syringae]QFZ19441.1 hypothetical protein EKG83_20135 [Saccharothrix syringae]
MADGEPLVEVSAVVTTSPEAVWARVLQVLRGAGTGYVTLEVDEVRRAAAIQGGWWYRGEWRVDAVGDGARLTHRVRNVARRGRWAVPLANRLFIGYRQRVEREFAAFVADLPG